MATTTKRAKNMLHAAYKAGIAFSMSYVGYVHAIAHSLGGQYGVPHGLANAVIHALRAGSVRRGGAQKASRARLWPRA